VDVFPRRDLLNTTNPKALTKPRGYYRYLAKTMVAERQKQMAGIPTEAVVETPRCAECNDSSGTQATGNRVGPKRAAGRGWYGMTWLLGWPSHLSIEKAKFCLLCQRRRILH
jgi:hypothetical protein